MLLIQQKGKCYMTKTLSKHLTVDDVRKLIRIRKRQLVFDTYPKALQDYLTRTGMNPYKDDVEHRIVYRDFTITAKEN